MNSFSGCNEGSINPRQSDSSFHPQTIPFARHLPTENISKKLSKPNEMRYEQVRLPDGWMGEHGGEEYSGVAELSGWGELGESDDPSATNQRNKIKT